MIRRTRIRGYKSLRDAEIRFEHPLAVVMGPNASGKSNLLDALGLLARMALSPSLEEAFRQHRGRIVEAFSVPPGGLREAMEADTIPLSFELDVELSQGVVRETEEEIQRRRAVFEEAKPERAARVVEHHLRYGLAVEYRPAEKRLRVTEESLLAIRPTGEPKDSRAPFIWSPRAGTIALRLEGQGARPVEFAAGDSATVLSRSHYPPHFPHVEALKRELEGWRFHHLEPRVLRAENDLKVVSAVGRSGEDLAAFVDTLKARDPARFEALGRDIARLLPVVERVDVERSGDGFLRLLVREGGLSFSPRLVSEGALRLLGLVAVLAPIAPTTLVAFEEPEASVHPLRIHALARLLERAAVEGGFQVIVNTHSPLLCASVNEECLIVCRREPEGTSFRAFPAAGPLFKPLEIEQALAEETPSADRMTRILRGGGQST